jgi:hypothetical protein
MIVFDIQTMSILQKPIERPLSKDVSPCVGPASIGNSTSARALPGESVARRSFSSFHRAEMMADTILWDGSRSKGLNERLIPSQAFR